MCEWLLQWSRLVPEHSSLRCYGQLVSQLYVLRNMRRLNLSANPVLSLGPAQTCLVGEYRRCLFGQGEGPG